MKDTKKNKYQNTQNGDITGREYTINMRIKQRYGEGVRIIFEWKLNQIWDLNLNKPQIMITGRSEVSY